jgi:predicted ATP-dependent endonuclease of OLD family
MVQENLRQLAINALRVGNFKAFSNTQYIPIRPLTLIYGGNSSGKSSILHSLLFAHHVIKNDGELDVYRTEAGGDSVDLGGFGQYVHRRDRSSVVEWAVDINAKILKTEILHKVEQFTVGVTLGLGQGIENKGIKVRSFFLKADGQTIADMSARRDGLLKLDRLDIQHPVVRRIIDEIMEVTSLDTRENVEAIINKEVVPKTVAKLAHLFPREIEIVEEKQSSKFDSTIVSNHLNKIIGEVVGAIEKDVGRLRYLGPLRTYPPRHFAFSRQ